MSERTATGRLPLLAPEELDEVQRRVYEAVTGGERRQSTFAIVDESGRLHGPFNAMLWGGHTGAALERLGAAIRFQGQLPPRLRELVVCLVAGQQSSAYEWYAHSRVAQQAGVRAQELAQLERGEVPTVADPAEAATLRLVDEALRSTVVAEETWEEARALVGEALAVEAVIVAGYYRTLAMLLSVAAVPAPTEHSNNPPGA